MNWKYRNTVLTLCLLAFFVTYFSRLAISPVIPLIVDDLEVTNTQIGFALSGMWFAYGFSQFPSGILADRYGEKQIILVAVGGTSMMSLLLALSPLYTVFLVCAVILGGAAGLHYSVATTLLSRSYDEIGTALGFHSLGGPLAGLIAPVTTAWIGVRYGWSPAVATGIVIGVPVFLLFTWKVRATEPRKPNQPVRQQFRLRKISALLSRPRIVFPLLVAIAGTYIVQGMMTFLPTFLINYKNHTPAAASITFSSFFIVRGVGQILIGRVSDQYSRNVSIGCSLLAGCIGLTLLIIGSSSIALIIAISLAGLGSSFFTAIDPKFMDELSNEERGTEFGLIRTIYTILGATGSVGVGFFADHFGWGVSFSILVALSSFTLLITVIEEMLDRSPLIEMH